MSGRSLALLAAVLALAASTAAVPRAAACCPPPGWVVAVGGGAAAGTSSWAVSAAPAVQSHFVRFTRASRTRCRECRAPRSLSFAAPGFSVAQLAEQARTVVAHAPHRYVIVDLGVRDLCTGTPLERFEQQLDRGLRLLTEGRSGDLPNFVLVASIEDVSAKWRVLRADRDAARAFAAGATMECGLGAAATPARVAALRVRAKALNEIIAEVCFLHVLCLYDRGTRFALPLRAGYFSPRDYRLLSTAGQRAVAAAEWPVALRLLAAA